MLYYRRRDDKGVPLPLPYGFEDVEAEKKRAFDFYVYAGMDEDKAKELIYGSR